MIMKEGSFEQGKSPEERIEEKRQEVLNQAGDLADGILEWNQMRGYQFETSEDKGETEAMLSLVRSVEWLLHGNKTEVRRTMMYAGEQLGFHIDSDEMTDEDRAWLREQGIQETE